MTSTTPLTPLRYSSPTVTLEVMAREAAVSQWSDRPVVEVLRYRLILPSEEGDPVEVAGDRGSFVPLIEAIQTYVQAQLTGETPSRLDRVPGQPYLEPLGLTQHRLHLGTLRTTGGQPAIAVGATQLADLSDVVDQLEAQVRPLPISLTPARQRRPWRQWGTVAAGMVAAVGITTALWPNYQSTQQMEDTALEAPSVESAPTDRLNRDPRSPATLNEPNATTESAEETPAGSDSPMTGGSRLPETEPEAAPEPESATASAEPEAELGDRSAGQAPAEESQSADMAPAPTPRSATRSTGSSPSAPANGAPAAESEAESADADAYSITSDEALTQRAASAEPGSLADLVQQVRDRWSPPDSLEQTLVYTLVFAADGTLTEVIPKDALAERYQGLAGLPAVGTVWRLGEDWQRVELRLDPSGAVNFREAISP